MSPNRNLISGGNDWKDSIPSGETAGVDGGMTLNELMSKGPAERILIQITMPDGLLQTLSLPFVERDETTIAVRAKDVSRQGWELVGGAHGVRLDKFLTQMEELGYRYIGGYAFHKPSRPDPTASLRFSRRTTDATAQLPDKLRGMLSGKFFDSLYIHANPLEDGSRRDCFNLVITKNRVKYGQQLTFNPETDNGDYAILKVERQDKRRSITEIATLLGVDRDTILKTMATMPKPMVLRDGDDTVPAHWTKLIAKALQKSV